MRKEQPKQSEDRLPPHDLATEQSVLGSVLDKPELLSEVITKLKPGPKSFYHLPHQEIYQTMLELFDDGIPCELIALQERLSCWGKLESCGGLTYLTGLQDAVTSTENLPHWIQTLIGKFVLRRVLGICTETAANVFSVNGAAEKFLAEFEDTVVNIRTGAQAQSNLVNVSSTIQELQNDYNRAAMHEVTPGIQTGFSDLDRLNGALMEQELIILAGLRSSGKTSLGLNIGFNVAAGGVCVGFISLETSGKKLLHRLTCYSGQVSGGQLLRGENVEENAPKVNKAFGAIQQHSENLLICERGDMSDVELSAVCRRMHQKGARLFIIDYLQLLNTKGRSEYERITAASKFGKRLAKGLNVPVIFVSALNRESEKGNKPRAPKLSDLRASGQIEYDADKAWLLYDPAFKEDYEGGASRKVALNFAKNKDGPTGTIFLTFFPQQFRMESISNADDDYEWPDRQTPQQEIGYAS